MEGARLSLEACRIDLALVRIGAVDSGGRTRVELSGVGRRAIHWALPVRAPAAAPRAWRVGNWELDGMCASTVPVIAGGSAHVEFAVYVWGADVRLARDRDDETAR